MTFLLDTNICVAYLRGKRCDSIEASLRSIKPGDVALCSVVKAELLYGAARSQQPQKNYAQIDRFFRGFPSFSFDDQAASAYGKIRVNLEASGKSIGPNDLMIAAIAVSREMVLVTRSTDEFSRVSDLKIENW